jgi:hypothetical protein
VKNTRSLLIHTTSLITAYRRYAEYKFIQEKNFSEALELLNEAFIQFEGAWIDGSRDFQLTETYSEVVKILLDVLVKAKDMNISVYREYERYFEKIAKFPELIKTDNKLSQKNIELMLKLSKVSDVIKNYLVSNGFVNSNSAMLSNSNSPKEFEYRGQVLNLYDKYGYIKHPSFISNVRFKAKHFENKMDFDKLQRGSIIYFCVEPNSDRKKGEAVNATKVRLA